MTTRSSWRASHLVALAVVALASIPSLPLITVLVFAIGVANALGAPGLSAILPTLVPRPYGEYIDAIIDSGIKIVETAGNNPKPFLPKFKDAGTAARVYETREGLAIIEIRGQDGGMI